MSPPTQLSFGSQNILEWLELPACILRLPDTVIESNTAFTKLCRTEDTSIAGNSLLYFLPEINVSELNSCLAPCNTPAPLAVQFRNRDRTCSMLLRVMPLSDPDLRLIAFSPMEINALQSFGQSQQAILEYQALLTNAPFGVVYSKNRQIVRYNNTFGELFGFYGNSGLGQPTSTLYPSEEAHAALSERAFPFLVNGKPFREEMLMRRQDGGVFWADAVAYLIDPSDPLQGSIWIINDISERKAMEGALHDNLLETHAILENASVALIFSRNRLIQRCNRRTEEIFGYAPGELLGKQAIILYSSEESYGLIGRQAGPLLQAGKAFLAEWQYKRKDGTLFWTRAYAKAIDPKDTNRGTVWMLEDITSAKATEDALKQSLNEMEALMRNASVGILITEARRMVHYNRRFAEMFGYENDAGIGQLARILYRSDEEYAAVGQQAGPLLSCAKPFQTELFMRRRDGSDMWTNLIGYVADPNDTSRGTFWILEDRSAYKQAEETLLRSRDELEIRVKERTIELEGEVNERRRAESRLRYLALHDPLTSLPNRNLLQKRIREALLDAHDNEQQVAIFFIDLDRFKTINDSLGHHIGDALLKKVAIRLSSAVRSDDTVARIGGDEFVIILPLSDGHERVASVAENILDALRPSFSIDERELFVTTSIGICLFPRDGTSVDTLMRNADTAMYQAKAAGRNNYRFFRAEMNAAADNYFRIESSLRQAIERNEFEVHYQPIIDLQSTKLAAFEALVRWRHPSKGLLAPDSFISIAEESGLIGRIGNLVMRSVCRQLRDWIATGYQPPRVAINLSPIQFCDPDLISGIARTLDEFGLTPEHIELEITETALMQDGELTRSTLEDLKKLGLKLAIDDFGTGYSSLAHLKHFPVDTLKIDRSFILNMTSDENDHAIVTAVLALAKSLHLSVIAEGVETEAQFAELAELGCDQIQGYMISRPLSAPNIRDLCLGEEAGRLRRGAR